MNFSDLVQHLGSDTRASLALFKPELALCVTIVAMLLVRVVNLSRWLPAALLAFVGAGVGLWYALPLHQFGEAGSRQELFTGLLVYDNLTIYFRTILLLFAVLFVIFTQLTGIPDREDGADFYSLVLGGTLGMCLMVSANHLLVVFLAVEMASVPSYALAGMLKGRRQSSEAALKYAIFGAGTAGVMLYGISLLAGVTGSVHLPTMAERLADLISAGDLGGRTAVLALGGLMIAVGLAFKLSAVPFHFWCPDVFEGASAEVNAFLSVASKTAALGLLVRVAVGLGAPAPTTTPLTPVSPPAATAMLAVADDTRVAPPASVAAARDSRITTDGATRQAEGRRAALEPVRNFTAHLIALFAVVTCTFGNLAAYGQTNIKRMLAYSTIAHAGYMMMPVAAALALAGSNLPQAQEAVSAIAFYTAIYLFMNTGAFLIVALLRNVIRSEEISNYAGLIRRSPGLVICFGAILFSLIGLPPLAGFAGKWALFAALVRGMETEWARDLMLALLVVGGINTALSLFYYLRVIKVMSIDPEPDTRLPMNFSMVSLRGAYLVLMTLPVFALGVWWDEVYVLAQQATRNLLQ